MAEHGGANSLVVGPDSVEFVGYPVFTQGDSVVFGLNFKGVVTADSGGEFVAVASNFSRSYDGGSKFKVSRTVPVPRSTLVRDNTGLALNRI